MAQVPERRKASTSTDRRNSSASDFRHETARRAVAGISVPGGTAPLPSALFPHLRQKTVRKGRFFFVLFRIFALLQQFFIACPYNARLDKANHAYSRNEK